MKRPTSPARSNGYALIEILVTLVILLIGLLGLAGVNARANVTELESYQRVQAMAILQDMVDRVSANRMAASCYSNGSTGVQVGTAGATGNTGVPASCAVVTDINSNPVTASQKTVALTIDLPAWDAMLKGSAEVKGGSNVGAMIGAVGCVRQLSATTLSNIYLVSVAWQGIADTVAPTDAASASSTCGYGAFGAETKHRMVTATVQIATLYIPGS